jgi:hypothetical protein
MKEILTQQCQLYFSFRYLELAGAQSKLTMGAIDETELSDYRSLMTALDEEVAKASTFYDQQFEKLFNQFYGLITYSLRLVSI